MLKTVTLDFILDGDTREEVTADLRRWVNLYAPTLADAQVVELNGPAGGTPMVKLVGDDAALYRALHVYTAGDEDEVRHLLSYAL